MPSIERTLNQMEETIEINDRTKVEFKLPNGEVIECCIRDGRLRIEGSRLEIKPSADNLIYVKAGG